MAKQNKSIAVITGDIINSKLSNPHKWMKALKEELNKEGKSPNAWEIYRGDGFQLKINDPMKAVESAIKIKASLRMLKCDVRMAIGIGEEGNLQEKVTESNGKAFIYSGEKFETLKKEKVNLAIRSDWDKFDLEMNLYLKLGLIIMDNWSANSAQMVKTAMENPDSLQEDLGRILGLKQNTISTRMKRANYEEIMEINKMFKLKLKEQC